jgi:hypothetical protein
VIHFPWKVREGLSVEFVLRSEHLLAANDNAPKQTKSHPVIIRKVLLVICFLTCTGALLT